MPSPLVPSSTCWGRHCIRMLAFPRNGRQPWRRAKSDVLPAENGRRQSEDTTGREVAKVWDGAEQHHVVFVLEFEAQATHHWPLLLDVCARTPKQAPHPLREDGRVKCENRCGVNRTCPARLLSLRYTCFRGQKKLEHLDLLLEILPI